MRDVKGSRVAGTLTPDYETLGYGSQNDVVTVHAGSLTATYTCQSGIWTRTAASGSCAPCDSGVCATCVAGPIPNSEVTEACPEGESGLITRRQVRNCPSGAIELIEVTNSCVPASQPQRRVYGITHISYTSDNNRGPGEDKLGWQADLSDALAVDTTGIDYDSSGITLWGGPLTADAGDMDARGYWLNAYYGVVGALSDTPQPGHWWFGALEDAVGFDIALQAAIQAAPIDAQSARAIARREVDIPYAVVIATTVPAPCQGGYGNTITRLHQLAVPVFGIRLGSRGAERDFSCFDAVGTLQDVGAVRQGLEAFVHGAPQ